MRKLVEYPTPSLAERERRWAAVRKEMDARGLDCLILCGWPAMWDFNIANARYLCPIGGNAEFNVLVFPRAGEPTSFIYSPVFTSPTASPNSGLPAPRSASTGLPARSIPTAGCRTACTRACRSDCQRSPSSISTT